MTLGTEIKKSTGGSIKSIHYQSRICNKIFLEGSSQLDIMVWPTTLAITSRTYPSFSVPSTTSSSVPLYLYIICFSFHLFLFLLLLSALAILIGTGYNGYLRAVSKLIDFPLLFVKDNNLLRMFRLTSVTFTLLFLLILTDFRDLLNVS